MERAGLLLASLAFCCAGLAQSDSLLSEWEAAAPNTHRIKEIMAFPMNWSSQQTAERMLSVLNYQINGLENSTAPTVQRLAELGSNVILLHHGFLERLRELPNLEPLLKTMLVMQKFLESGGFYHAKTMG